MPDHDTARIRNEMHGRLMTVQARYEAELRDARTELAVVRALLGEAMGELRRLERVVRNGFEFCASCEYVSDAGHAPDCTLAAVLARGTTRREGSTS